MIEHPEELLSAYLDDALALADRARVESHLVVCQSCRARLQELRTVSRLLASLPERALRRSLLPSRMPAWLVPARFVSSAAAAVFAFVFVLNSGVTLAPLGAPAAPAPDAPAAVRTTADETAPRPPAPAAAPAPTPSPQAVTGQERKEYPAAPVRGAASPTPLATLDVALRATPAPRGAAPQEQAGERDEVLRRVYAYGPAFPTWGWLVLAGLSAALAFGFHRAIERRRR